MKRDKLLVALEVLQEEEKELLGELADVRKRIASYKRKLADLAKSPTNSEHTLPELINQELNNSYDREASWVDKVFFLLESERRFLHSRELQQMIDEQEPGLKKDFLQKRVGSALHRLKKDGSIISYQAGSTKHTVFWGSKNWLDESGKPKKEHDFNRKYLAEKKSKKRVIL